MPQTNAIYVKCDGQTLKAYAVVREPTVTLQIVDPRKPLPAGLNQIMSEDEARAMLKDLIHNGQGKKV